MGLYYRGLVVVMLSVSEAQVLARESFYSPAFFCRTFLPEWFYLPMPWFHRGMLAILARQTDWLLDFGEEQWAKAKGTWDEKQLDKILRHFVWQQEPEDPSCPFQSIFTAERTADGRIGALHLQVSQKMLFIMPRGASKTTLVNAHNLREVARCETPFMVYLSETATHAEEQLQNVKGQISANLKFIAVFGEKQPKKSDPERWAQNFIQTTDGTVIAAKGRGGQVRGKNVDGKRPDLIIFDDVEDVESVKTEEQREKTLNWLKSDVENALPQIGADRGRLVGMGTILGTDALLPTLARSPEWLTIRFGAVDPAGEMLWDHYMSKEKFNVKRASYARLRKLHLFNMEFLSTTRAEDEGSIFQSRFFKYAPMEPKEFADRCPGRALMVDPAISDRKDSDFCAFAVVGITEQGQIYVAEVYMERGLHPRDQVNKYFELHAKWDCNKHGIETVAYQKALEHLVREEMFRRGKTLGPRAYFEIETSPATRGLTSKEERIEGILAPRYAAGYITHNHVFHQYEMQLLDYPNGKKDGPDVVAMAITLLDPYAAFAFDPEDADPDKLAKDQFKPLEDELGGEWRMAP